MTEKEIELAAAAIANARAARCGVPPINNVLSVLTTEDRRKILEDAKAALQAVEDMKCDPI